jgi:hypothetical protein
MRKFFLLMMLATTAATPALAQDRGFGDRLRDAVEQRRSQSADRPVRAERQPQQQQQRVRSPEQQRGFGERVQRRMQAEQLRRLEQGNRTVVRGDSERGFNDRLQDAVAIERARQSGDLRDGRRDRDRNWRDSNRDWRDGQRYDHSWRDSWRRDHRYDWRRHRDRNRSLFRFGVYYDPFGWSYRPYGIGYSIRPSYWDYDYWLRDPWMYRLPPVYGPYRWIRYWDDALLVDTRTGRVVDVIRNVFW